MASEQLAIPEQLERAEVLVPAGGSALDRNGALPDGQQVDAEGSLREDLRMRPRLAVDAGEQRGRIGRQRAHRRGRHADSPAIVVAVRQQRDGGRMTPERLSKELRVTHPIGR